MTPNLYGTELIAITAAEEKLGRSLITKEVDKAIGMAQREIVITKSKAAHQYKYAPLPEILSECYPVFEKYDLVLQQPMIEDEHGRMILRTIITHTPSGQWVSSKIAFPALKGNEKNECHAIAGMHTYWRRYNLLGLLGLGCEDDDGKQAEGYSMKPQPKPIIQSNGSSISEAQIKLLLYKIKMYPNEGEFLNGRDLTQISKSEFNGILSRFPDYNQN